MISPETTAELFGRADDPVLYRGPSFVGVGNNLPG